MADSIEVEMHEKLLDIASSLAESGVRLNAVRFEWSNTLNGLNVPLTVHVDSEYSA